MSEKSARYLSIAQRCAARGEIGRAIVKIVNTLSNNPDLLESQPEAIDFLAEILVPGFEEEIHRLEARYPSFGYKFHDALLHHGRDEFATKLELSFHAYCVERMKQVQYEEESSFSSEPELSVRASQPQYAASSGLFRASQRDNRRVSSMPLLPEASLPDDVWLPSIQASRTSSSPQLVYEKHEFTSHNTDSCATEGIRRFDRIRTQSTQNLPKVEDLTEAPGDHVILDFDDRLSTTPKAAMFAAAQTKFRSYEEELAQWREENPADVRKPIRQKVLNPDEIVAEATHALSETPSVEPYIVRHPIRFHLTMQHITVCVFLCLFVVVGLISWKLAEPTFEKRALLGISETYLTAVETGQNNPIESVDNASHAFVSESWLESYKLFLTTWQTQYFKDGSGFSMDSEDPHLERRLSASHAAYITQETSKGHYHRAKTYFEQVPQKEWRDHSYFKTWSEAQLSKAGGDYVMASSRYEKLMRTPLAPFALVELGLLSLEDSPAQREIQNRFLEAAGNAEVVPALARCTRDILLIHPVEDASSVSWENLRSPYFEYCSIGQLFKSMRNKTLIDSEALKRLESSSPLEHGEEYRIEAIIEAELQAQHAERAISYYKALDMPEGHPARTRLLMGILDKSSALGSWQSLRELNEKIPSDISFIGAARVIDTARETGRVEMSGMYPESLFRMEVGRSGMEQSALDEAWSEAEDGHVKKALSLSQAYMSSHPEHLEPLYLQAILLSRQGNGKESVSLMEHSMLMGRQSAALVVMSNLYRSRHHLPRHASSIAMPYLRFTDPLLESARCEFLWNEGDESAKSCFDGLKSRHGVTKLQWYRTHLSREGRPTGALSEWKKAGSGLFSVPGYYLGFARKLLSEGEFQSATRAYTNAILQDRTTSTREVIEEFSRVYSSRQRRYEGTKKFEELIVAGERDGLEPEILGYLHISAAYLYQPENGHSTARQHLGRALELLGDRPEILRGLVQYYEAKEKPDQARSWRLRLKKLTDQ